MTQLNRRNALKLAGSTTAAFVAGANVPGSGSAKEGVGNDLNLDSPEDNLTAYVKMYGSLSGKTNIFLNSGRAYAINEGERAKPIFGLLGLWATSFNRVSTTEFRGAAQYFGLFTDINTDRRLETLINPLTGAEVSPPYTKYPRHEFPLTPGPVTFPSESSPSESSPSESSSDAIDVPEIRHWTRRGNHLEMTDQIISPKPPQFQPDCVTTTYFADWNLVQDPTLDSVPCSSSFTAVEHWKDWLEMGDLEGSLVWHVTGHKLASLGEIPQHLIDELGKESPDMLERLRAI